MGRREIIGPAENGTITIPVCGPRNPREFTADEKEKVVTILDFELPFALEDIQGSVSGKEPFFTSGGTNVIFLSRQRNFEDIAESLKLSAIRPPKSGVVVAWGDRHGRVNVTALQFQFQHFVALNDRDDLFDWCLDYVNEFLDAYRQAKRDYTVPKVVKDDIFAYRMFHRFHGAIYNDLIQPVARLTLKVLPHFPDDMHLWNNIWFEISRPTQLWNRLIHESRYYLAFGDHHFAVVNAVTALENVIKTDRFLEEFFQRHGIPFDRWKDAGSRESLTQRLYLLNLLYDHVELDKELIERVIKHYNTRNNIIHGGTRPTSIEPEKACRCVDDIHQLIRIILDEIHLSIALRLTLVSFPPPDTKFQIIHFSNQKEVIAIRFMVRRQCLCCEIQPNDRSPICLRMDLQAIKWEQGNKGIVAFTYDAHQRISKLIFNTAEIDRVECDFGIIDASLFQPQVRDDTRRLEFMLIEYVNLWNRALQPHELADIDALLITSNKENESD